MATNAGTIFGRGISFPPRIGGDGRLVWSEGETNVRESIRVILMTEQPERLRAPSFGGSLGRFLFEPNTVTTRRLIQDRITKELAQWEPRIQVQGQAGWYRGDVVVHWTCGDALSGIPEGSCPEDTTVSGEGRGRSAAASV